MIGLRIIFLKHKLMRTFCQLTHEEDGSSISNNRSTNHFAISRISWKFLRTVLLTNVQRDVALRRGWLVRFVEKETQKRGDVGDRRRTRGNTRRIRFFSVPSVSYTRRSERLRSRFASILDSKFFPVAFPFPMLVSSRLYHVDDSISDGRGEQGGRKKNRSVAHGKFSNRNDSRRACFFSWKFMLYYHRRDIFETHAPRGRSDPTVTKGYF